MAANTVENSRMANEMELLKQSMLTAIFAGEYSKMGNNMDIVQFSSVMETHTSASTKMERRLAMAFREALMELHIMGSGKKIKERDSELKSMPAIMCTMDNTKMAIDKAKQFTHTHKQEELRKKFGSATNK